MTLLRVGTLWRCGDSLFFEVPPLASDALLTTLHPFLENLLQTVNHFALSSLGAPSSWLEKPRNRMGRDLDCTYDGCSNGVPPFHFFQVEHRIQFISRPMLFLGFSNPEKGASRQEISKWSTVCSTFSRSGWRVVRSASLSKGGTSKRRPSSHLYKVPTRNNKVSPRILQAALVQNLKEAKVFRLITYHVQWIGCTRDAFHILIYVLGMYLRTIVGGVVMHFEYQFPAYSIFCTLRQPLTCLYVTRPPGEELTSALCCLFHWQFCASSAVQFLYTFWKMYRKSRNYDVSHALRRLAQNGSNFSINCDAAQ
jgi:hypothetical protein